MDDQGAEIKSQTGVTEADLRVIRDTTTRIIRSHRGLAGDMLDSDVTTRTVTVVVTGDHVFGQRHRPTQQFFADVALVSVHNGELEQVQITGPKRTSKGARHASQKDSIFWPRYGQHKRGPAEWLAEAPPLVQEIVTLALHRPDLVGAWVGSVGE